MPYLPALDGLRGFAIYLVFMFHASLLPGGFIGVDMFFTFSGFLITALILNEHRSTGTVCLKAFYIRRAMRLLPALFALVVTIWLLGFTPDFSRNVLPALLYYTNFYRVAVGPGNMGILEHTWSLSIEEQFYLIWPWLMLLALKFRRRVLIITIIVLIAIVNCWRIHLYCRDVNLDRFYNFTDTRIDSILWGCGLAASFLKVNRYHISKYWIALILLLIVSLAICLNIRNPNHLLLAFSIVPPITAIIIGVGSTQDVPILNSRILIAMGKVSYGLYLWHVTVLSVIAKQDWPATVTWPVYIALSAILTIASYYFIEKPFLKLKRRFSTATFQRSNR